MKIAFAYYVGSELIGFYADSFGSIRDFPKIYTYSLEQVKIILGNARYKEKLLKVKGSSSGIADKIGAVNSVAGALMETVMNDDDQKLVDAGTYQLKMLEITFPYETGDDYPREQLIEWKKNLPEAMETYEFSVKGEKS